MRANTAEIARQAGVDFGTAKRAIQLANVPKGRGGYDLAEGLAAVEAWADPARVAGHAAAGRGENASAASQSATDTLAHSKAEAERFRALKLQMEVAEKSGQLVSLEHVRQAGEEICSNVATALLGIGSRVAPRLLGQTDALAIQLIVTEEVKRAMGVMSDPDKYVEALLS